MADDQLSGRADARSPGYWPSDIGKWPEWVFVALYSAAPMTRPGPECSKHIGQPYGSCYLSHCDDKIFVFKCIEFPYLILNLLKSNTEEYIRTDYRVTTDNSNVEWRGEAVCQCLPRIATVQARQTDGSKMGARRAGAAQATLPVHRVRPRTSALPTFGQDILPS